MKIAIFAVVLGSLTGAAIGIYVDIPNMACAMFGGLCTLFWYAVGVDVFK